MSMAQRYQNHGADFRRLAKNWKFIKNLPVTEQHGRPAGVTGYDRQGSFLISNHQHLKIFSGQNVIP